MSSDYQPGSRQLPYNLAIIGGGPAGSAIILRAIHLNLSNELLSGKCKRSLEYEGESAGVCIFDIGPKTRFGGGKLQDYKINSNTNGAKFVTNLTQDRPNVLPPEVATGTPLEHIGKTKLGKFLLEYRATTAPLDHIGKFLVEVGDVVLNQIDQHSNSKYYCETEVIKIQQYNVNTKQENNHNQQNSQLPLWRILATNLTTKVTFETYSRYVVLATGGKQTLPKSLPNINSSKLLSSDYVCTDNGISELITRLKNYPRKRIVIIGGSHSAFSAAWICLNKLGWNSTSGSNGSSSNIGNNTNESNLHSTIGNSNNSSNNSIYIVHRHEIKVFYACKRDADRDKYNTYEGINKQGQIHPFSGLRGDAKALYRNIRTGIETRVRLLSVGPDGSNHQTLYARLCEEAHVVIWACGYEAALNFSIVDSEDIPIPIVMTRGQVEVNDLAQVLTLPNSSPITSVTSLLSNTTTDSIIMRSNSISSSSSSTNSNSPSSEPVPISNLLATGLGFGLNVSGDSSSLLLCKADGVAVYLKRAATLILSHILGTKVFGEGILTWEQHVVENVKRWNEQQALLRASKNNDGDEDDNEYAQIQPCLLSPSSPTRHLNKIRCPTPVTSSSTTSTSTSTTTSSPILTSPIRRQIRTASSSDFSSRRKREGNQIGITNNGPHPPPKKIPPSPIVDKKPRQTLNKHIKNESIQNRTESKDNIVDSGDSDPYELYLSGLVSVSTNNTSEKVNQNNQNHNQNHNQFSPLPSPKIIHEDTIDCDESLPPPPYSLELDPSTSMTLSESKVSPRFEISTSRSEENKDLEIIPGKLNEIKISSDSINSPKTVKLNTVGTSNSSPVTPRKLRSSSVPVSVGVQHSPNYTNSKTLSPHDNNIPIAWTTSVSSSVPSSSSLLLSSTISSINSNQKDSNQINKTRKQSNPQTIKQQLFNEQHKETQTLNQDRSRSSHSNNHNNNHNNTIKKNNLGPKVQNLNLSTLLPNSKALPLNHFDHNNNNNNNNNNSPILPSTKHSNQNIEKFPSIVNNSNKQQQQQQLSHESRQSSHQNNPPSLTSLHGVKKLLVIKSSAKVS
mmetsp:Transcript_12468/g.12882  ORF Transcript_12468/g.12882 Transcript_12468/m.12882 type:complete len:1070 (-) Transcript_12468:84-3293(-)